MEETLIKVTDVKGTVLKPIDATFKVEYKYEGETTAEVVLEGDVKRGTVIKDDLQAEYLQREHLCRFHLKVTYLRIKKKSNWQWQKKENLFLKDYKKDFHLKINKLKKWRIKS